MSNVGKTDINFKFAIGDRAVVDSCESLIVRVIGLLVTPDAKSYKVAWFEAGRHQVEWIDEFRLEPSEDFPIRQS